MPNAHVAYVQEVMNMDLIDRFERFVQEQVAASLSTSGPAVRGGCNLGGGGLSKRYWGGTLTEH